MHQERNEKLRAAYQNGETITSISARTGISPSQLSRIFRATETKRKIYELDKEYFDKQSGKTLRQISEETGIPIKRVTHLYKIAYGKKITKGETDFTKLSPEIDQNKINDRDWLHDQYILNRIGTPSIARKLGMKASDVIRQLKKFDIPLRNTKEASEIKEKRPNVEWLNENYVEKQWSITKCAQEFGVGFNAIYTAIRTYGIKLRDSSEQHEGELNEFYGQQHDDETIRYCSEIGSKYGKLYWLTGDTNAKIEQATYHARQVWSDPAKRAEQSKRITELCIRGACNSKQIMYIRQRDNKTYMFKSSWELSIASFLEECDLVQDWEYENFSIPYHDGDTLRNFIIDFEVKWISGLTTYIECKNKHLLNRETNKIEAALKFLRKNRSNLVLVTDINDLKQCSDFPPKDYLELRGSRYQCGTSYLEKSDIYRELLRHHIVMRVSPWKDLEYSEEELRNDMNRLRTEKIELYFSNDEFRATVPNSKGMPGRQIILHNQPHFMNVVINNTVPLTKAFDDRYVIYRSILQSMEERESLTIERLLREINFHFTNYGRTSHFAVGFARAIIRHFGMSGKSVFDPCCGWGGRLLGSYLEGCSYSGCEISPLTYAGLSRLSNFANYQCDVKNVSCLDADWSGDFIMTSPPFHDVEEYIGGEQPWQVFNSRKEWIDGFVDPFISKVGKTFAALYLDGDTMRDYDGVRKFDKVIKVAHRRHARRKIEHEFLCVYE